MNIDSYNRFREIGGRFLGNARRWIQRNCINGDMVHWQSNDVLQKTFTVANIEEIAVESACGLLCDLVQSEYLKEKDVEDYLKYRGMRKLS